MLDEQNSEQPNAEPQVSRWKEHLGKLSASFAQDPTHPANKGTAAFVKENKRRAADFFTQNEAPLKSKSSGSSR